MSGCFGRTETGSARTSVLSEAGLCDVATGSQSPVRELRHWLSLSVKGGRGSIGSLSPIKPAPSRPSSILPPLSCGTIVPTQQPAEVSATMLEAPDQRCGALRTQTTWPDGWGPQKSPDPSQWSQGPQHGPLGERLALDWRQVVGLQDANTTLQVLLLNMLRWSGYRRMGDVFLVRCHGDTSCYLGTIGCGVAKRRSLCSIWPLLTGLGIS